MLIFLKEGSMLKKSLLLSIAVLLTAVIFIFTGCEGPAGPAGSDAANGDINFPGDITVSVPGSGTTPAAPSLPEGVTYPLQGAKLLSGNAADISTAFNGGILVANTPDSGVLGGGTNAGTVYAQDAVDAIVWTGIGADLPSNVQGNIVVPPGKTLFIAADLPIGPGTGRFQGVTLADKATYSTPSANPSILADTRGGTTIDGNTPEGKIVILNGGSIQSYGAGLINIGGGLEIHRGGFISVGAATFTATAGSVINSYGLIDASTSTNPLTLDGELVVKGYGTVKSSQYVSGSDGDVFRGQITVESYGKFILGTPASNSDVDFYGAVNVQENAEFTLSSTANHSVTFHNNTDIAGTLTADYNNVNVAYTGHLKIASTGKIEADRWALFSGIPRTGPVVSGTDKTLLAAIAQGALPSEDNNFTTIEIPLDGMVTLEFSGFLDISTYADLNSLAKSTQLFLPGGIRLTYASADSKTYFTADLDVKTNDVFLNNFDEIGNVTVEAGKVLTLEGSVEKAGTIAVYGNLGLIANNSDFSEGMDGLIIGQSADIGGDPVEVNLPYALFGGPSSDPDKPFKITVNKGSKLTLGNGSSRTINPRGIIELEENAELTISTSNDSTGGAGTQVLDLLEGLRIEAGAKFSFVDTYGRPTFAKLQKLTVNGILDVNASSATTFHDLQTIEALGTEDVQGTGTAIFAGLPVNGGSLNRAFEQLLAIRHLTIGALTNASVIQKTDTPDAGLPPSFETDRDRPTLTVASITASTTSGLVIGRDLIVTGNISFGAADNTITINPGYRVKIADIIRSPRTAKEVLNAAGTGAVLSSSSSAATTLAPDYTTATFTLGVDDLLVLADSVLNVTGKIATDDGGNYDIIAGEGTGEIVLAAPSGRASYLERGSITTGALDTTNASAEIAVSGTGTLAVNEDSTVGDGSSLAVSKGGTISVYTSESIVFGTLGLTIGAGALTGGDAQAVIAAAVTANTGDVTISGELIATEGSAILTGAAGKKITIASGGSISARNAGNAYEYIKLAGNALIDGVVVFDATDGAPVITLTGKLTGGTLTTKESGKLVIGTVITLQGNAQDLSGVTLDGTALSVTGTTALTLAENTTLAIGAAALKIGAATLPGTLTVNGGKITLAAATSSIVLLKEDAGQIGNFVLGSGGAGNTLKGLTTASGPAALATYGTLSSATGVYGTGNITIAGTGAGNGYATLGATATVTVDTSASAGQVTITGGASGNTITKDSGICRI
jgi:hypothetical protein